LSPSLFFNGEENHLVSCSCSVNVINLNIFQDALILYSRQDILICQHSTLSTWEIWLLFTYCAHDGIKRYHYGLPLLISKLNDTMDNTDSPITFPLSSHQVQLEKLCRFCGSVLTRTGYCYDISKLHFSNEQIDLAFGITTTYDEADIHPKKYCNKCYTSLMNFKRRGCKPSFKAVEWSRHTEKSCDTCLLGQ